MAGYYSIWIPHCDLIAKPLSEALEEKEREHFYGIRTTSGPLRLCRLSSGEQTQRLLNVDKPFIMFMSGQEEHRWDHT